MTKRFMDDRGTAASERNFRPTDADNQVRWEVIQIKSLPNFVAWNYLIVPQTGLIPLADKVEFELIA